MSIQNILSLLLKFVLDKGYTSLDYREEGFSEEKIRSKLVRRFFITPEQAQDYCKADLTGTAP